MPDTSRQNIWVDFDTPDGTTGFPLASVALSKKVDVTNGVPIIVERAMWWPGNPSTWYEAHNSPGTTTTGTRWGLAEGEVTEDARRVETFILVANTSPFDGAATVTLMFEDGSTVSRTYTLARESRTNVYIPCRHPDHLTIMKTANVLGDIDDSDLPGLPSGILLLGHLRIFRPRKHLGFGWVGTCRAIIDVN